MHESTQSLNLDASYTYDTEGKMASVSYPSGGNTYTYSFDSLDRPDALTDQHSNQVVGNVQYNAANQILAMNYFSGSETRQYNSLGQVTSIVASGSTSLNRTYTYPTGTNNGKISSMTDNISGETVTYQYDSLNRLISAAGSGWGETYGYDAFGNLLSKTPTAGSPPTLSIGVNTANNQVVGYPYDANGNLQAAPSLGTSASLTYDAENRIVAAPGVQYGYDSQNKRVWVATLNSQGQLTGQTAYFYGVDGSMLAAYTLTLGSSLTASGGYSAVYFGNKRVGVAPNGTSYSTFIQDRQGSQGSYYPFGEDKGTPLPNDQYKYATYWRDSATSLDYAKHRYYINNFGRFMTPDPYRGSASTSNPQSWNRFTYVLGDPINLNDPRGLLDDGGGDPWGGCLEDWCDGPIGIGPPPPPPPPPIGPQSPPSGLANDLSTLEQEGVIDDWELTNTGVDLSFVPGVGVAVGVAACVADPVCDVVAAAAATGLAIYIAYRYWPPFYHAVQSAADNISLMENVADTGILTEMYNLIREYKLMGKELDPCDALATLAQQAQGNPQKLQRIKATQKAYGCRRSSVHR